MSDLDGYDAFDRLLNKLLETESERALQYRERSEAECEVRRLRSQVDNLNAEIGGLKARLVPQAKMDPPTESPAGRNPNSDDLPF